MIESYGLINDRAPHLIADLCEIICYFENREISRGDVETLLMVNGGDGLHSDLDLDELDSAQEDELDSAQENEQIQILSEDVFQHLSYRAAAFGIYYPFLIQGDILTPVSEITQRHKIYAALLAFSRLKMFSAGDRSRFALFFEELCVQAAMGFARTWEVVHFGVGGRDRDKFGYKLKEALVRLSRLLREIPVHEEIESISENNVGDGGVDIVIYRKWSDPARAVPCFFAQCTAQQTTWPGKRFDASPSNLDRYINFFHKPGVILFIPLCYRSVDGRWIDSDGRPSILVDRKRLLELIDARLELASDQEEIMKNIPMPFDLGCTMYTQ